MRCSIDAIASATCSADGDGRAAEGVCGFVVVAGAGGRASSACTTIGTPLDRWDVFRRFLALLTKAGVPRRRFHDLRHTAASLLFAQGIEPRVVMEILGHSRIATTLDIYTHLLPHARQDAADKMDAILGA